MKFEDLSSELQVRFDELGPDLQARARGCKTPEEMLALAKEEGHELTLEELEAISGGEHWGCKCDEEYSSYNPVN